MTEVVTPADVELVSSYADCLQVGTRNAQNYKLLEAVGKQPKPVLYKRGMWMTLSEYLQATDYILSSAKQFGVDPFLLGGLNVWGIESGLQYDAQLFTYQLTYLKADRLSLLFGYLFHLALLLGMIFALHVEDPLQHVAAFVATSE